MLAVFLIYIFLLYKQAIQVLARVPKSVYEHSGKNSLKPWLGVSWSPSQQIQSGMEITTVKHSLPNTSFCHSE